MKRGRNVPESDDALAGESDSGMDDASGLLSRLYRYQRAHHRALRMADYALEQGEVKWAYKLRRCGEYLVFRDYFTAGKIRLHAADFCKKHLLCPLCAIRRAAKQVKAYLERLRAIGACRPFLSLSLVTLTVKDGADLGERFRHLAGSFRQLQQARRSYLRGKGPCVELAKVDGAVGSYEFKRGSGSGLWHPHLHMVCVHDEPLNPAQLSADWRAITGDSFIVDVTPFHDGQDPAEGFLEVFKYALKFSSMELSDNWQAFKELTGRRLVFSFGLFYGVDVPESLGDEPLDELLPFVEMIYRYLEGCYSLARVSPPIHPHGSAVRGMSEAAPGASGWASDHNA